MECRRGGPDRVAVRRGRDGETFAARFSDLCRTADAAEAIALYRGLPLYPGPERLEPQAAEGVRTNMRAVFEAVAHRNPYPPSDSTTIAGTIWC